VQFLNTLRIGQITGSPNGDPSLHLSDPQGWPLLNDTSRWSALGLDEGANTEHQGRLYFFVGDVLRPDWWKTPLNNSHFVGWTEDTGVLRQGGHVPMGFNFVLPHDIGEDANHQGQWRYCVQCSGLFFDGYADKQFQNRCPQGGSHAPAGFNFVLPHELGEDANHQGQWRYCVQCGGLFFDGYADKHFQNACPKGGSHAPAGYQFVLPHDVPEDAHNQATWRYCIQCGGIFWNGNANLGPCPGAKSGGGFHLRAILQPDGSYWPFEADAPLGVTLSDEPASAAFSYGGRVYVFVGAGQAHWSGQTRPGEPMYGLYLVSTDRPDQPLRYRKEFLFNPRIGVCPADGGSHDVLGYNFALPHDISGDRPRDASWFHCRKCAALFQGFTRRAPIPVGPLPQGGVCPSGGTHEANPPNPANGDFLMALPYNGAEDALNQGKWRRCVKCESMFWTGYSPNQGVCPADHAAHQPADQINYVLPHDQPEDANHQANWRRCLKCYGTFWDGLWMKGVCPAGGSHDAQGTEDIEKFLQDELILTYNTVEDANHQGNWRFCTKCYGLFFDGYPAFKGVCPVDHQPHAHAEDPNNPLPQMDSFAGYIHPPVGYNFVLPHDLGADKWHQAGWRYCTKCAVLFQGKVFYRPGGGPTVDNGRCPAGGPHAPAGFLFVLPQRLQQDSQTDRDWRFCTKCFAMVSTKASGKFWTVASVVVRNSDFPGLPSSPSGDGVLILGYGWSDFYLAWLPLGGSGPRIQDTLYYSGPGPGGKITWDRNVDNSVGLFGVPSLADPNHISMAWLEGPRRWIVLYGRPAEGDQNGFVVARIGMTPWTWSPEIPIISPSRASDLYTMVKPGTWPYGPYILNRFTEWNGTTRELGIYYLISLSTGYQMHLMYTRIQID
jgi:hypothetical protein